MTPVLTGIIGFVVFFILLAAGTPVGITLGVVGFAGIAYLIAWSPAMSVITLTPFSELSNYYLSCLPLFILMAYIIFEAGFGKDLYNAASKWVGSLPGGLAMATTAACAVYGAMCADSLAETLAMSKVSIPEMDRYHYKRSLSIGALCVGGPLAILIPPSNVLIIYGILTETSIGKLFIAGIIPGILAALFYMVAIYIMCRRDPSLGPAGPSYSLKDKIISLGGCIEVILLVVLMLGGLMIGWFNAVEAASVGTAGAFILALYRRRLNWEKIRRALFDTAKATGFVYVIIIGAFVFMPFMQLTTIPTSMAHWVGSLNASPLVIMGAIIIVYLILGCFLESLSMMMITIPIFFPMLHVLGFDAVWFGILIVRVVEIGLITPPVGLNVYTVASVTNTPLQTAFKGIMPFLACDVVHVALMLFFPAMVMILPSLI